MRKKRDDDFYAKIKCPKCGRKNCVQGLVRIDGTFTPSKITHLFRCTYIDCHHEWEDEESNEIKEVRKYLYRIVDKCCEEGLESIRKLHYIMDMHVISEKAKESLQKLSEVIDDENIQ